MMVLFAERLATGTSTPHHGRLAEQKAVREDPEAAACIADAPQSAEHLTEVEGRADAMAVASTQIRPPCISMMRLAIDRPRPVLFDVLSRAASVPDCRRVAAPHQVKRRPTADIGCLFDHLVGERKQLVGHRRPSVLAAYRTRSILLPASGWRAPRPWHGQD